MARKHIYIILALSAIFTLVIQLELTRSIFFDDYLLTREIGGGAMNYYLSLINESSKGNWALGSPYLLEWRNQPYLYPALNINAAGLAKRALGLDIKSFSLLMDYSLIFVVMSLLLFAFLALFQFSNFGYLAAILYIFFPRPILWNRTLSPEINFIPLSLFFIFYFSKFSFWKRELGLGILSGILFYIYPYYWTFALPLLAISDLSVFIGQRKIIWQYFYKYAFTGAVAFWYAVHLLQISHLSYYRETMVRIGALYSRFPAGLYTQAVLLASIAFFFFLRKNFFLKNSDSAKLVDFNKIIPGLLASLVVLNQQLITGMQLEFNSHYLPVILIFLISFWSGLFFIVINKFPRYKFFLKAIFLLLAFGLILNRADFAINREAVKVSYYARKELTVTDWFIKNNIQDRVVYAPEELNDYINFLSNNYLYFNGNQELLLMPTEEIIDRFTYFDLTNKNITEDLPAKQVEIFGQTFKSAWQKDMTIGKVKAILSGRKFSPKPLSDYVAYDFRPMQEKRTNPDLVDFIRHLDKYQVSYLVYRQRDKDSIYNEIAGKIVFEDGFYIIKERN